MFNAKCTENVTFLYKNEDLINHRRIKSVWKKK